MVEEKVTLEWFQNKYRGKKTFLFIPTPIPRKDNTSVFMIPEGEKRQLFKSISIAGKEKITL